MTREINQPLIDYLKVHTGFITSNELSHELKVAKKTIARHVSSINKKFSEPIIISKRGRGYQLNYNNYLNFANRSVRRDSSMQLRQRNILIKLLFAAPQSVRIIDLVNSLYVSESVFQNDEKDIREQLKKWDLTLSRKNRMIRIVGKERDIRSVLVKTVLNLTKSTDIKKLRWDTKDTNAEDFDFSLKQVDLAQHLLNGFLPYPYNVNFFAHIYVLLGRVRKYKSVDKSIVEDPNIKNEVKKNPEIFSICQQIVSNIQRFLNLDYQFWEPETYYLFEYLLTSRFNSFDGVVLGDEKLSEKVTNLYIETVSRLLDFRFDPAITTELQSHVLAMISRLKMKISLPNALLNEIKIEYHELYQATSKASKCVCETYRLPKINEDETGFICLYFAKYYEDSKKIDQSIKTYVICTTGIGTSGIISTRIKNTIPDIKIVGMASSVNIEKILESKTNVDLLISTIPISKKIDIPIVLVSAFFTKQDEKKVRKVVRKIQDDR